MRTKPIADAISFAIGGGWGEEAPTGDTVEVAVLRGADFPDAALQSIDGVPVRHELARKVASRRLQSEDLILEISGGTKDRPTGRTVFVTERMLSAAQRPVIPASFCRLLRIDRDVASPRFIFYALQHLYAEGGTWAFQNRSTGLSNFQFELFRSKYRYPDVPILEQRAIAEVLGALDDKIAANASMLSTIEGLMNTLFDQAVMSDAVEGRLGDFAVFHNRRRVPLSARERDARPGNVPYYGATGIFGFVDEALFDERLLLVGEDGSVIRPDGRPVTQYVWGPAWVNNHAHVLTGVNVSTEVLHLAVARCNVTPLVTGAVQPKISMGNLRKLTLTIPGPGALQRLESQVQALKACVRARTEESKVLAMTRDALLPGLMSGRIRVKDAERVVGEAV